MKSPMVTIADYIPKEEKSGYSDLQVMQSAAGYYIGTVYKNIEKDGSVWYEPGSRDSDYFKTREDAEKYLKYLQSENEEEAQDAFDKLRLTP